MCPYDRICYHCISYLLYQILFMAVVEQLSLNYILFISQSCLSHFNPYLYLFILHYSKLMQFEKLHIVAHTQIVGKLSAKSKQNKVSLTHLYKCKFVLKQKEKRNIAEFTAKLTILRYDQLHTSLLSNGMAAIPKIKKTIKFCFFRN